MLFRRSKLSVYILCAVFGYAPSAYSVEFNTDILDAEDRNNIDLSRFQQAGYIMPGTYLFALRLNDRVISDQEIVFKEFSGADDSKPEVRACLTEAQVELLGLKPEALEKVRFDAQGHCADFSALEGVMLRGDLAESALYVSVPQAWLEYQDSTWLPPSRWENGIPGMMLDYSLNTNVTKPTQGSQSQSASASGTLGANLGAWRLRGDWQGSYNHTTGNSNSTQHNFDWSRVYAYRALPGMMAKLTLGETYLTSDIFDSWRFTGASLASDETQLPPKLRGYAPEVSGIARTNAKVTVSQQGRVLYETTVAAGPFRIQDLNSAVNGELDVKVEEQDGSVQTFQVTTATVPYLTRPGQVRYKLATGRPSDYTHHVEGPYFTTAEASWGITNSWSLYGGGIFSQDYNSLAVGLGRDLYQFGALSADITQSMARLPDGDRPQGRSYRVSYSKRFEEISSNLTFAGYRFSERDYLSMPEYLDARYYGGARGSNKELYTVTASKSFEDLRLSTNLSWSHQTYWNRPQTDRYSLSTNRYFDIGDWRNMSATVSASRSDYNGRRDDSVWLSLSLPLGGGTASYNGNWSNNRYSQTAGWYQRLSNDDSYRLTAGTRSGNGESLTTQASGYYNHTGDMADMTASISWQQNSYTSGSLSLNGGLTVTGEGAALHGSSGNGGTRMMVSTDGVAGVPIGRNGKTNAFGIAVEPSVASYYRTTTEIDVTRLPDDVETAGTPVAEAALTEGAIGFRRFDVLKGAKVVAILTQEDGTHPPFGVTLRNSAGRELGMVSDGGLAWISGVNPNEQLNVYRGSDVMCTVTLPPVIPAQQLLLPCTPANRSAPAVTDQ
ncbi:fimbria/pilus outer membrane usher protein [Enterobacter sp. Acro-832]|uniref:fimbria/pilus outer membrane usher protein n=1 Tax=Enterobacter sp. Acro-832 TaxID=2608348 RepID=UPI001420DE24|nr:fimbria/pilus outer membrane usher protein [Enterobacter sp. Acro-832]NIG46415.1 fimbria/pilus outer membrane usher protein [Enterobacter sp. Acro-832]